MSEPGEADARSDLIPLSELTRVQRGDVYKNGLLAAHLSRTEQGDVRFTYTSEWIGNAGPPIATTLPVTSEATITASGTLPAYFAGLLPEGRRLTALRRGVKTSPDDELSLLLGVGGDTIGDVRVLPEGEDPATAPAPLEVDAFAHLRFADLLQAWGIEPDRVGLPGVQDKVSAAMLNLPVTSAGAQVLLKLNPAEFKHLVENEYYFLGAARHAGITTVGHRLVHDREGVPGLVVSRFDRVGAQGRTRSLPVEDGCQVLGLPPGSKYLVTTERLLAALSAVCEAPLPAASEFLRQVMYAYLTGNGDAHAKNFSVLQDLSGRWQPTPAYDLPSSHFYGDQTMALPIEGRSDGSITGARFMALGLRLGLRERAVRRMLTHVAASADAWVDGVEVLPFDAAKHTKFKRVVRHRQQMLTQV